MKHLRTTLLVFLALNTYGQKIQKQEEILLRHEKKSNYWFQNLHGTGSKNASDSLGKENNLFKKVLLNLTKTDPASITYPFSKLESVAIVSSPDKKFRVYSRDLRTGGTMHFYDNIFQYQTNHKVFAYSPRYAHEQAETGAWIFEIFEVNIQNKKSYLAVYNIIGSSRISYQKVKAFSIENQQLNSNFKLFKSGKNILNEIGFEFDFSSVADRPERPVRLIKYDAKTRILKIPVVLEFGKVTKKFIHYEFDGRYFIYKYTR